MNKQLKEAQELEQYYDMRKDEPDFKEEILKCKEQAKANMKKSGCLF